MNVANRLSGSISMITSPNATDLCSKGFCEGTTSVLNLLAIVLIVLFICGLIWIILELMAKKEMEE